VLYVPSRDAATRLATHLDRYDDDDDDDDDLLNESPESATSFTDDEGEGSITSR
jgi:hypothetical protein